VRRSSPWLLKLNSVRLNRQSLDTGKDATPQASSMNKERMVYFSDAVIAIIITIMVLELKVPHGAEWSALVKLTPVFLSYVLSFIYLSVAFEVVR
jgi:uncharacterized membrane protein